MRKHKLTPADQQLIAAAKDVISRLYQENRHHIGAAVRTQSGRIFTAVHLDTYVGRASVCAEAVAIGKALSEGERDITCIVSVRHPRPREAMQELQVVSPCGICRELLSDFAPACEVIVPADGESVRVPVTDLLPNKYQRQK
ncbi:MAG TPA: cytidine deaminase [Candidatus Cybelea sp.]|nr:cytidine deaminase [Candidatus Cybelea sp.]